MERKTKIVFIINDNDETELMSQLLRESGIENEIGDYLGKGLIVVPEELYLECLEKGTSIAKKKGFKHTGWLNYYDEPRPLGYLPLMYCFLPNRRMGNTMWEILEPSQHGLKKEYCPMDIKKYLDDIKMVCGRNVAIRYNGGDNAIEVMLEAKLLEYDRFLKQLKAFNKFWENIPFKKVIYLGKNGELIKTEETKPVDKAGINSYFYQSLFYEGLAYPYGSNISPKEEEKMDLEETGFKGSCSLYGLRKFDINSVVDNGTYKLSIGNFVSVIEKTYSYYWDADARIQKNMPETEKFTMIDNGNFNTQVSIESSEEVIVDTLIKVVRSVVGYNYDGKTVRDKYFNNNNHDDERFNVRIREYFKLIKSNRLIHYSDNSNLVELYDLPEGWTTIDGLEHLNSSKVYDYDSLEKDEDYLLIKQVLDSSKSYSFTKGFKKTER